MLVNTLEAAVWPIACAPAMEDFPSGSVASLPVTGSAGG